MLCRWCGSPFRLEEGQLYVAPAHPQLTKAGTFSWRMCNGSNRPGTSILMGMGVEQELADDDVGYDSQVG